MSQQIGKLYPLCFIVWQAAEENEQTYWQTNIIHSNRKYFPLKAGWGNVRKGSFAENSLKPCKVLQPWQGWNYTQFCLSVQPQ